MNRAEFMKELEYLLQDISREETEDALQYYRDYLEEAGEENEEQVIREFGSPERIAAIIRADILGTMGDGGEFTENGYRDERFRDPGYQVAERKDRSEEKEKQKTEEQKKESGKHKKTYSTEKVILISILVLILAPLLLSAAGAGFGFLVALAGILVSVMICLLVVPFGLGVGGVVAVAAGIFYLGARPLNSVMSIGLGIALIGGALLCFCLTILFFGRFLPWLFREIHNGAAYLLRKWNGWKGGRKQ